MVLSLLQSAFKIHAVRFDRSRDVFELLRAKVLEDEAQLVDYLIAHDPAYAYLARLGQRLQTRCDIDTVPENVFAVDNDVTNVDAEAEVHPLLG